MSSTRQVIPDKLYYAEWGYKKDDTYGHLASVICFHRDIDLCNKAWDKLKNRRLSNEDWTRIILYSPYESFRAKASENLCGNLNIHIKETDNPNAIANIVEKLFEPESKDYMTSYYGGKEIQFPRLVCAIDKSAKAIYNKTHNENIAMVAVFPSFYCLWDTPNRVVIRELKKYKKNAVVRA